MEVTRLRQESSNPSRKRRGRGTCRRCPAGQRAGVLRAGRAETPVPVELDHRALVVGEAAAGAQSPRETRYGRSFRRAVGRAGDGESVNGRVQASDRPLPRVSALIAHHRVHHRTITAASNPGPKTHECTGQGGDGEKRWSVDPVRRPPARQRARQRHRQRGITVGEGGDEGTAGHERGR